MLTDAPPRKHLAGFRESDRIKSLDLPADDRLPAIAMSIESAMKACQTAAVRSACAEFLKTASRFYQVPECGIRVLAARPLRTREHWTTEFFGDYAPETMMIRVWMRTAIRKGRRQPHGPIMCRFERARLQSCRIQPNKIAGFSPCGMPSTKFPQHPPFSPGHGSAPQPPHNKVRLHHPTHPLTR